MRKAFKNFIEGLKKDERGMTLVELLAVIVILAIVGAIAFVVIGNVIENSRQDAHISNAQQIINAAELYQSSGSDVEEGNIELTDFDTLADVIADPWGDADYRTTFTLTYDDEDGFEIASAGGGDTNECAFEAKSKAELSTDGRSICNPGGED
jgi:type IV pilus assembly protein PilA